MKQIPKRAKIKRPEPIVVKIDPETLKAGIVLPKVKYEVQATVEQEQVFHGVVLPIPKILIMFLNHCELMLVATIMEETNEKGECDLTSKELAKRINVAIPSISSALYTLRKIGLLQEMPNGKRGAGRIRIVNYKAMQHLNDLVEGEDFGIFARIRKATKKTHILHLTKEDIRGAYNNIILAPGHNPAEEEEYD